ncbi:hypothetical protein WEI85_08270 [Actinomycetes bacterium KLBMP 9797]
MPDIAPHQHLMGVCRLVVGYDQSVDGRAGPDTCPMMMLRGLFEEGQ